MLEGYYWHQGAVRNAGNSLTVHRRPAQERVTCPEMSVILTFVENPNKEKSQDTHITDT